MKRSILTFGVLVFAIAGAAQAGGASDAKACKAMQATIAPRQAEIAELTKARDASADVTELAGQSWDDVEIHRLVSTAHTEEADRAKAGYEAARGQLARNELALQDAVRRFNTDVSEFNARCAPKR